MYISGEKFSDDEVYDNIQSNEISNKNNQNLKNQNKSKNILLKLSGEILSGENGFGHDIPTISSIAKQIKAVIDCGHRISIVVGGGNICRGATMSAAGMNRTAGDHMGMLATVINAIVLQNFLEKIGIEVIIMSAIDINDICEPFRLRRAMKHIEKNRVLIFAAGTGNPFFSTDTAAVLRAIELKCDELIKGTKVDGIYDKDPAKFKDAVKLSHIKYEDVLVKNLNVMDMAAIALAHENKLSIKICSILNNSLTDVIQDTGVFSTIN